MHGIKANDQMAYRLLGGDPWHIGETRDRCRTVGELTTGPEMQKAAKLDYALEKVSLGPIDTGGVIPDVFGVRRTDTRECLRGVAVGRVYEILQPTRLFEFAEAIRLTDEGAQWETAGSLFGGRKIWGLIRLNGHSVIRKTVKGVTHRDEHIPHALVTTSFDASQNTIVQHTDTRVVCWNTLSAALSENGAQHRIRHCASQEAQMKEAAKALGHAIKWHEEMGETWQRLADAPMSLRQAREFFACLLTEQDEFSAAREAIEKLEGRKLENLKDQGGLLLELFQSGTGNAGVAKDDALNAVTEFADRQRARIRQFKGKTAAMRLDSALDSSQFGSGAKLKQRALRLLTR